MDRLLKYVYTCRRHKAGPGIDTRTARLRNFGMGPQRRSMSHPAFRLCEKFSCSPKGGIEYDFTWCGRQQVRRCRTGRLVAMGIPATKPHC